MSTSRPRATEETIDIENAGATVPLRMWGADLADLYIRGDAVAEYQWDARPRGGTWVQNIDSEYTGQSDYQDTIETGAFEVRLRCSTGSAGAGDQATVTIMAGRG